MSRTYINGELVNSSTNYAAAIEYTNPNGSMTTVQDGIDNLRTDVNNNVKNIYDDMFIIGDMTLLGTLTVYGTNPVSLIDNILNYKGIYIVVRYLKKTVTSMMKVQFVPKAFLESMIAESRGYELTMCSDSNTAYYLALEILFTDTTVRLYRNYNSNFTLDSIQIYGIN